MRRVGTLRVKTVSTSEVTPHPENPRHGDVDAIARSLSAHGQYRPIVVQQTTGYVLAGNHTLLAANRLGWDRVAAVFVDVDDDQARRILLVDNRTADLGTYDDVRLADLLAELAATPDLLDATGYTEASLDALLRTVPAVKEIEAEEIEALNVCPKCGYEWR